ncbi:hypothetical protein KCV06_g290, partial [Aureobasidium melanogenum]
MDYRSLSRIFAQPPSAPSGNQIVDESAQTDQGRAHPQIEQKLPTSPSGARVLAYQLDDSTLVDPAASSAPTYLWSRR